MSGPYPGAFRGPMGVNRDSRPSTTLPPLDCEGRADQLRAQYRAIGNALAKINEPLSPLRDRLLRLGADFRARWDQMKVHCNIIGDLEDQGPSMKRAPQTEQQKAQEELEREAEARQKELERLWDYEAGGVQSDPLGNALLSGLVGGLWGLGKGAFEGGIKGWGAGLDPFPYIYKGGAWEGGGLASAIKGALIEGGKHGLEHGSFDAGVDLGLDVLLETGEEQLEAHNE